MIRYVSGIVISIIMISIQAAASPVSVHGALQKQGSKIIGSTSHQPVQLAGPSLYWTLWGGEKFYNDNVVATVANNWNASVIRAAIGVEFAGGYLEDPQQQITYAKAVVDAAIKQGIYVVVDWHDHNANIHIPEAKTFFTTMASAYSDIPNIIWEIWNEPDNENGTGVNGFDTWEDIRAYADSVIPVIRVHSSNLIVVGTPQWSSDPLTASKNPINDPNVAYTLHFYAGTHGASFRETAESAMNNGAAIFITEFGTTDASGGKNDDKNLYLEEANTWLDWADINGISWANWSLSNIDEPCSALKPKAPSSGTWPDSLLSPSGAWLKQRLLARPAVTDTDSVSIILTVSGNGTITSQPQGLRMKKGTEATFTAVPSEGWIFKTWGGATTVYDNPVTITVNKNTGLTAVFIPAAGTNMLHDGTFSDGGTDWVSWVDTSSSAEFTFTDSVAIVTISKADTINWHIQLVQKDLELDSGATYFILLDAWSSGERELFVGLSTDETWHFQGGETLRAYP